MSRAESEERGPASFVVVVVVVAVVVFVVVSVVVVVVVGGGSWSDSKTLCGTNVTPSILPLSLAFLPPSLKWSQADNAANDPSGQGEW